MWGSLSRARRATVKRISLVLIILIGISLAVDKYKKDAVTHGEVLPWHKGGYMDHHSDLEDGVVPEGGKWGGARISSGWDGSVGDFDDEKSSSVRYASRSDVVEIDVNAIRVGGADTSVRGDSKDGPSAETLGNDLQAFERLAQKRPEGDA